MQVCKQVTYYERGELVLPSDTTSGWTVRLEMEDGTSFVFDHNEVCLNEFIVVPDSVADPTFEDYPDIIVDWSSIKVDWINLYTILAIMEPQEEGKKPKLLRIICHEKADTNFWEEIWPSHEDTSLMDP